MQGYIETQPLFLLNSTSLRGRLLNVTWREPAGFFSSVIDNVFAFLLFCRVLHLSIIHEDIYFTQYLIQIFPKEVLDIQNNLYQVSTTLSTMQAQCTLEFFNPKGLPHYQVFDCGSRAIIYICVLPENCCSSLFAVRPLSGTSLWVVPELAHKGLWMETPLLSTSCRNRTAGRCGVYPCVDVGGGIVPVLQEVKPET